MSCDPDTILPTLEFKVHFLTNIISQILIHFFAYAQRGINSKVVGERQMIVVFAAKRI